MQYLLIPRKRLTLPEEPPTMRQMPNEEDIELCRQYEEDEGPPTVRRIKVEQ